MHQAIARRFRPQLFSNVIGQESVVTTLQNALKRGQVAHAYLFSGPRGVGKTTLARLFAKALNCVNGGIEPCNQCPSCLDITSGQSLDVLEIDGASNRGIDDIRQITESIAFAPSHGRYKIILIDEVHMLTKEAFNALLKTLEEPPPHAKFFFATTEPHKVLPTIVSRCQRFELARFTTAQIEPKLLSIAQELSRPLEPAAAHLIANHADGSLRDAESLLDQLFCFTDGPITASWVRSALGLVPQEMLFSLDQAIHSSNLPFAFQLVDELYQSGKDLLRFYEELIDHIRLLTQLKITGEAPLPSDLLSRYKSSAELYSGPQLLYVLEKLLSQEGEIRRSLFPRASLESLLLSLVKSRYRLPVDVIARRLLELETALKERAPSPQPQDLLLKPQPLKEAPLPPIAEPPRPQENPLPELSYPQDLSLKPQEPPTELPRPQDHPSKPQTLKEVPFHPLAEPLQPQESPSPEATLPPPPKPLTPISEPLPTSPENKVRYDTLIRFAAIELEGTIK